MARRQLRRRRELALVMALGVAVSAQNAGAQAGVDVSITRPEDGEAAAAAGGVFAITGVAYSWDESSPTAPPITNVGVYCDGVKLGDAAILGEGGSCSWVYLWTNVAVGSVTALDARCYSTLAQGTSSVISAVFFVTNNAAPVAEVTHALARRDETNHVVKVLYSDANSDQVWTPQVETPPSHGTISNASAWSTSLYYTPSKGYVGTDSFTYRVSDGQTSSPPAVCQIFVHGPTHSPGQTVLMLVSSNLLAGGASNAIFRLKEDLTAEQYGTELRLWPASDTSSSNVWQCLRDAYTNTTRFLAGAILIGDIPRPASGTNVNDLVYWNLRTYRTNDVSVVDRQIWVSRLSVDSTSFGSESTLMIRALDANHAYRRGESRLPFTAYRYKIPIWMTGSANHLSNTWPVVEERGVSATNLTFLASRTDLGRIDGADCMVKGGELFEQESHGNSSGYMSTNSTGGNAWVTKSVLHRNLVQTRVCLLGSCSAGQTGGIANEHLFTRGGGCVLAISPSADSHTAEATVSSDAFLLNLLGAGFSWGDALVENWSIGLTRYAVLSGDLSLRPMASVYSNSMPVISDFTASSTNSSAGLAVDFSVTATDPDGTISNVEWFLTGFNGGRASPTFSGTATKVAYIFGTPGTYTARVEAVDNYQARVWREMAINVSAAIPHTLTVTLAGRGSSSLGALSPATRTVPPGSTTQIVFTASDWYRLKSLAADGVAVPGAVGVKVYTQVFSNVSGNISNAAVFAIQTPAQTGYTNVPTAWLTNWTESSIVTDTAFDVYAKYLLGLSPATSNTFGLQILSCALSGSNLVTVIQRHHTGGLSPDGMHGALVLQMSGSLTNAFTNLAATAVTGASAFDGDGRKTYTNTVNGASGFYRARIQAIGE